MAEQERQPPTRLAATPMPAHDPLTVQVHRLLHLRQHLNRIRPTTKAPSGGSLSPSSRPTPSAPGPVYRRSAANG